MICYYCALEFESGNSAPPREASYALGSDAPRCVAHWRVVCGRCGSSAHFMASAYCPDGERFFCSRCAVESDQSGESYRCWVYSFRYRSPWSGRWQPDLGLLLHERGHPYQAAVEAGSPFPSLAPAEIPHVGTARAQRWSGARIDADTIESAWDLNATAWHDAVADDGDESRRFTGDEVLLNQLGDVTGQDVLDLGCGNGYLSRKLAAARAQVSGVDPSAQMIRIAEDREAREPQGIRYVRTAAAELHGFAPWSFDFVVANHVLTAVPDLIGALSAINGVLRPGGKLVALISHPCFSCGPRDWVRPAPDSPREEEASGFLIDDYFRSGSYLIDSWPGFDPVPYVHRPIREYWSSFNAAGFRIDDFDEPGVSALGREKLAGWQVQQWERIPTSCVFTMTKSRDAVMASPTKEAERT